MKWRVLALTLLLVPFSGAQGEPVAQEDFQDDTVGQNPTAGWYTYSEATTPGNFDQNVVIKNSDQRFGFQRGSGDARANAATFTLNEPGAASFFEFIAGWCGLGNVYRTTFQNTAGQTFLSLTGDVIGGQTCSEARSPNFNAQMSGCTVGGNGVGSSTAGTEFSIVLTVTFNWDTQQSIITAVGDPDTVTCPFAAASTGLGSFQMPDGGTVGQVNGQWIDEIQIGNIDPGDIIAPGAPAEFDTGLIAFAASAGFISAESQMLFALILIGLATVTTGASSKWVAPGRFKNYLLLSVQCLIALFAVIVLFLEPWMFMVAFMLGLFAVRGGAEVRNTFFEIKGALDRAREPVRMSEDGSVMGGVIDRTKKSDDGTTNQVVGRGATETATEPLNAPTEPLPPPDEAPEPTAATADAKEPVS